MKNSILDRYQMGDVIGEGSFGIVYIATNKKSGAIVRDMIQKMHVSTTLYDVRSTHSAFLFLPFRIMFTL